MTLAAIVTLAGVVAAACAGGSGPSDESSGTPTGDEALPVDRPRRLAYGDHDDAFGDLWTPASGLDEGPPPVVVLIHGGFWRDGYFLDLMDPLVPSLLERGVVVWNIEYRRVGAGGGDPETFDDVAAAIDHLAILVEEEVELLDVDRVAVVGHSAGGQLAVWAASRPLLTEGVPGSDPVVVPTLAVSQAGVLDLVGCADSGIGGSACSDLLGATPSEAPDRYARTSPTELLPIDARVVAVHGDLDRIVPPAQSEVYVDRAVAAGSDAELQMIVGADHFSHLDPTDPAWLAVLSAVDRWRT